MTTPLPLAEGPLRVLIAYSYSAHYRRGVFEELLAMPGLDVTIAAGQSLPSGAGPDTQVAPIEPGDLPAMQWHRTWSFGPLRFQPGLLRRSLSSRYDVVIWDPSLHCVTMWISSAVLRARGRTLIYWGLGWTRTHNAVKERLKVGGFRLAHAFLTYGERSAELARAAGYPAARLYVVGNSVSDSAPAQRVASHGLTEPEPLVLGVALRLTERKRVDLLIRAVAALNRQGVPTRAVVVGDGPARADLEALRDELGVDVTFTGAMYDEDDIARFYSQVHLSVIPGHAGLTVTSSLMHGRPVITHNNFDHHAAEWEAIREGISGAFFAEGDERDLVAAIITMRDQMAVSAEARREIARRCRADYAQHGSPQAHAARIVAAAQDVIVQQFQLASR
ncbi:MAG: glycosyltransferase family 4 protein [Ornithinimicrobium sp.]